MRSEVCSFLRINRQLLFIILPPVILIFIPIVYPTPPAKCAYVLLVMIAYWLSECVSIGVTGILPLIFFPLFGISKSKDIAPLYMQDVAFVFLGCMSVATAMARTGLHKRLALRFMLAIGQSPAMLTLGIMITSAFCSMWISNTVTTVMMLGIIDAIADEMSKPEDDSNRPLVSLANKGDSSGAECELIVENSEQILPEKPDKVDGQSLGTESSKKGASKGQKNEQLNVAVHTQTRKLIALSTSYSATCGGIATMNGSATNLILVSLMEKMFQTNAGLTFGSWLVLCLPLSVLMLLFAWLWLQIYFFGFKTAFKLFRKNVDTEAVTKRVKKRLLVEYQRLGSFKFSEGISAVYFLALLFVWLTRIPIWGKWFQTGYVSDSCASAIAIFLCVCTPISFGRKDRVDGGRIVEGGKLQFLLTWKDLERYLPWELFFLAGGGFAISEGCKVSGLNRLIGESLSFLGHLPTPILILTITAITATLTEVTTNMAVVSIVVPILSDLCVKVQVNPLLASLPATLACSFAFMLPVATPPNAVVYTKGYVTIADMAKCGLGLNIIAVLLTTLSVFTYMDWYLALTHFPAWASNYNQTIVGNTTTAYPPSVFPATSSLS